MRILIVFATWALAIALASRLPVPRGHRASGALLFAILLLGCSGSIVALLGWFR